MSDSDVLKLRFNLVEISKAKSVLSPSHLVWDGEMANLSVGLAMIAFWEETTRNETRIVDNLGSDFGM